MAQRRTRPSQEQLDKLVARFSGRAAALTDARIVAGAEKLPEWKAIKRRLEFRFKQADDMLYNLDLPDNSIRSWQGIRYNLRETLEIVSGAKKSIPQLERDVAQSKQEINEYRTRLRQ